MNIPFIQIIGVCIFSLYLIYLTYKYLSNHIFINIFNDNNEPSNTHSFSECITSEINAINKLIVNDLSTIKNDTIKDMALYGAKGGKRVRALIISKIANSNDGMKNGMKNHAMLFIEYLHASSLIMDDIMDGDTHRRGRQCSHIKYGTTMAQITSIYLLSLAFVHLNKFNNYLEADMSKMVSTIIFDNFHDLADGQFIDLLPSASENIDKLISEKTSTLFQMSYILGYIIKNTKAREREREIKEEEDTNINNITDENINKVKLLSDLFGKIFQISDDFDDYEKDKKRGSTANYIISKGRDTAMTYYHQLVDEYNKLSVELQLQCPEISEIIEYLTTKVK